MWSQFKAILPSVGIYFALSVILCFCGWMLLKRMYTHIKFPFFLPFGFAVLMTLHFTGQNLINFKADPRGPASVTQNNAPVNPIDMAKMKIDFLNTMDGLLSNPQQVTVQLKNEVFSRYGKLFMTTDVKKNYETNIGAIYVCQRAFFEDALVSLKNKKVAKSDVRKRCVEMDGKFFGREKLIPTDFAKSNEEMLEKIAKGKPVKQGNKEMVMSEKALQDQIATYNLRVQTVQAMFQ